jgi:hypothetical protein
VWVKLDDGFAQHPKVCALGEWEPFGISLSIAALCWSSRYMTDGHIPANVLPTLRGWSKGTLLKRAVSAFEVAERLVEVGLWDRHGDDYRIHNFLKYNPSAADAEEHRRKNAAARSKAGQVRADGAVRDDLGRFIAAGDNQHNQQDDQQGAGEEESS